MYNIFYIESEHIFVLRTIVKRLLLPLLKFEYCFLKEINYI